MPRIVAGLLSWCRAIKSTSDAENSATSFSETKATCIREKRGRGLERGDWNLDLNLSTVSGERNREGFSNPHKKKCFVEASPGKHKGGVQGEGLSLTSKDKDRKVLVLRKLNLCGNLRQSLVRRRIEC